MSDEHADHAQSLGPLAVNIPPQPEIPLGIDAPDEPQLPLASDGVRRYVWKGRFVAMLIEVKAGAAYVNGQRVEPYVTAACQGM